MLNRYSDSTGFKLPAGSGQPFADQAVISAWASEAVASLKEAGIVSGGSANAFNPKASATRAEAAKMVSLLIQSMMK